jgi:NAD(P)-dependent dehydrogenase (short-subunit alcohol dehydrogenase family)
MGLLDNMVAVVAGVGPGVGRALALALAREGADVALGARNAAFVESVATEVQALGRGAVWVPTDVTIEEQAQRLVTTAADAFGRLDAVINNAFATGPMTPIATTGVTGWRETFEVNVIGALNVTLAAVPYLAEAPDGSVVMINSQAARRSQPRRGPYSASKAALLSTARTLAGELGRDGIRVNTVVPGHIWGPALEAFFADLAVRRSVTPEEVYASVAKETALRRIPSAEDIANAAVFFVSPLAGAITGQSLDVNAGNWFD